MTDEAPLSRRPTRRPPSTLFTGRELFHLLRLIVTLVVVLYAMVKASNRDNWAWLETKKEAPSIGARPTLQREQLTQTDECTEVNPVYLEAVKDKTPDRPEETSALLQLLCVAATQNPMSVRSDLLFANLANDPQRYRGQWVHVTGVLRMLTLAELPTDSNPYSIGSYYEGWIFTDDQPTTPMRLLLAEPPTGVPAGNSLRTRGSIDGIFFKLTAYQDSQSQGRWAPTLIGRQFVPEGPPTPVPLAVPTLAWFGLAGIGVWLLLRWRLAVADRHAKEQVERLEQALPNDLDFLDAQQPPRSETLP